MSRRSPITTVVLCSAISLAAMGVLFRARFALNPWDHYVSFSPSFHVGVWGRWLDLRLVFFNEAGYGPYRGSIIDLEGASPFDRKIFVGDTWGVYYRYFHYRTGETLWTLMVSVWYPLAIFALAPAI